MRLRASRCDGSARPGPLPSHLPRMHAVLWGEGQARQMARRPSPCPHGPGSFAGPPRCRARVGFTSLGKLPGWPVQAPRVRDTGRTSNRLHRRPGSPGALQGLLVRPGRVGAPGRSGTRSPGWQRGTACALGPREPRTPARVRPNVARIAVGGEPGEEGRCEDRNMLTRTPARAGPGSPDREGSVKC